MSDAWRPTRLSIWCICAADTLWSSLPQPDATSPCQCSQHDDPLKATSRSLWDASHCIYHCTSASSVSLTPVRTIVCGCLQLSASLRDARHRLAATQPSDPCHILSAIHKAKQCCWHRYTTSPSFPGFGSRAQCASRKACYWSWGAHATASFLWYRASSAYAGV